MDNHLCIIMAIIGHLLPCVYMNFPSVLKSWLKYICSGQPEIPFCRSNIRKWFKVLEHAAFSQNQFKTLTHMWESTPGIPKRCAGLKIAEPSASKIDILGGRLGITQLLKIPFGKRGNAQFCIFTWFIDTWDLYIRNPMRITLEGTTLNGNQYCFRSKMGHPWPPRWRSINLLVSFWKYVWVHGGCYPLVHGAMGLNQLIKLIYSIVNYEMSIQMATEIIHPSGCPKWRWS